jgi:Ca-activated chloride channel family protein
MTRDSRKTAAILCAAGALIVTAILLQRSAASGGSARTATTSTPDPTPADTPPSCDAAPDVGSRATARMGRGRATGALSAGKILRGTGGEVFATFDLAADAAPVSQRQPLNLALVIDRSGSMEGDKIQQAQAAALALIDRLDERDRIALIQYDDAAQVLVPSVKADREGKQHLAGAVRALRPGGATNLHGGMSLGRDEVLRTMTSGQVSRVILLSDGLANAGESSSDVIADAARQAADKGVRITSVGVGLEYNEDLMEAIAESGRGNYYYVRDAAELERVLGGELSSAQATVASGLELRLRPACTGVSVAEVYGYETRRDGDAVVVPMADLFGGDSRRMIVALRVPDRVAGRQGAVHAELRYRDVATGESRTTRLSLALDVTDDQHAAEGSIDREVMAQVLKAQSARSVREAARAYQQGDAAGAGAILRSSQQRLKGDGDRYRIAPADLAPAMEEMSGFAAEVSSAPAASDEGKDAMKRRKNKARDLVKGK